MSRRTRLVAVIIVAALVAIGALSAITIQSAYDSNLSIERAKLAATAQVTTELVAQQIEGIADIAEATVQRGDFLEAVGAGPSHRTELDTLQPLLGQVRNLRPDLQFAAVADSRGTTVATAPPGPGLVGRNFAFRDWYRGVMRTRRTYVSTAYISAAAGMPLVVAIATPFRAIGQTANGPVQGILFVGYGLGHVQAFADRLAGLQGIDLQITDQAGVVMARRGGISGGLVGTGKVPLVADALAGRSVASTTDTAIEVAVPVAGLGWTVSATTPLSATLAAAQRSSSWMVAGILLGILVIAGGLLLAATARVERTRAAQAASEAELRTVYHSLTDALQFFDRDGALVSRNPAAERLYELREDERTTSDFIPRWELLREDGTPLPVDEGPLAVTMRAGVTTERIDVGIRRRSNGSVRWLSVSTAPIRGRAGEILGYVSAARDVTEQMRTIRELRVLGDAAEQLGSSLVPNRVVSALTSAAAALCSAPGETQRRAQLFVLEGETMIMTGETDVADSVRADGARIAIADHPYIREVIASGQAVRATLDYDRFGPSVVDLIRSNHLRTCVWIPLMRGGHVFAILAIAGREHDLVTPDQVERLRTLANFGQLALSNAEAHQQVAELARTDPLTGVANRRALSDQLTHLPRLPFSLVAIDVDNLKTVNDTHGHKAGDQALRAVATACLGELRPSDLLARTGGDEFVVLLLDCDSAGAAELGQRLRAAVASVASSWGRASISVGSASGDPGMSPAVVAQAADRALYQAKERSKLAAVVAG